jgi:hypothetical protein
MIYQNDPACEMLNTNVIDNASENKRKWLFTIRKEEIEMDRAIPLLCLNGEGICILSE